MEIPDDVIKELKNSLIMPTWVFKGIFVLSILLSIFFAYKWVDCEVRLAGAKYDAYDEFQDVLVENMIYESLVNTRSEVEQLMCNTIGYTNEVVKSIRQMFNINIQTLAGKSPKEIIAVLDAYEKEHLELFPEGNIENYDHE